MIEPMQTVAGGTRVGRVKRFDERMHLTLVDGTKSRIDSVLEPDEDRLALARMAIDREIARRLRARKKRAEDEEKSSDD